MGGDDYIIKPFSIDELGARVAAHIRREHRETAVSNIRFFNETSIDYSAIRISGSSSAASILYIFITP